MMMMTGDTTVTWDGQTNAPGQAAAFELQPGDGHGGTGGRGAGLDGGALVEVVSVFAPAITIINMVTVAGVAGDLGVPGVSSS